MDRLGLGHTLSPSGPYHMLFDGQMPCRCYRARQHRLDRCDSLAHPALAFKLICTVMIANLIFEQVQILNMECRGHLEHGLENTLTDVDLVCVHNPEAMLEIRHATWQVDSDIAMLENRILSRKQQGRLLRLVHLLGCSGGRRALLFRLGPERFADSGVGQRVGMNATVLGVTEAGCVLWEATRPFYW
jgi:hypothetical protein